MSRYSYTCIIWITLVSVVHAQSVPPLMNYQGRLTDEAGQQLPNGAYRVAFRLFAEPIQGIPLWLEEQSVSLLQGNFNAVLGTVNPAITDAFNGANRYLELTVLKDTSGATINRPLLPRQQILSAPYAMTAGNLIKDLADALCPPGSIMAFGGAASAVPDGWLLCDGRPIQKSDTRYSRLYTAIGTAWGEPDANSFRIPDLRGLFLRGVDADAKRDPEPDAERTRLHPGGALGNNVGSYQSDSFKEHDHPPPPGNQHFAIVGSGAIPRTFALVAGAGVAAYSATGIRGGKETRPKNAYVNYIIKF
jgi:hypothetical protein